MEDRIENSCWRVATRTLVVAGGLLALGYLLGLFEAAGTVAP